MAPEQDQWHDFAEEVGHKEERKIEARRKKERSALFFVGMFGLVGWSVAVPTVIGALLGAWLDEMVPQSRISWTLTGIVLGLAVGCLTAFFWVKREYREE